jgi:hypothetical protein
MFEGLTLPTIIFYICLFAFTGYILSVERKDVHCPTFTSDEKDCDKNGGMAWSYTSPSEDGTVEGRTIKWRKTFVLSVCISAMLYFILITPLTFPTWNIFLLSILIIYVVLYMVTEYYTYHIYGQAENNVKYGIEIIKKKCISS